jgi:hypothetical protein
MYNMMDADFFVSCLFFIVGLIILNYVSTSRGRSRRLADPFFSLLTGHSV